MSESRPLGRVVAFPHPPNQSEFHFIASPSSEVNFLAVGIFVVVQEQGYQFISVIEEVLKANRYFSDAEAVKSYEQGGVSLKTLFPLDKWEFMIAKCKVISVKHENGIDRPTFPISPGSMVFKASEDLLNEFLGFDPIYGLNLGELKNHGYSVKLNMTKLLQKHLAILSISGGGKSYTVKVLIEELLKRQPRHGRPAVIVFDVHGEYTDLAELPRKIGYKHSQAEVIPASLITIPTSELTIRMFDEIQPNFSQAQLRELGRILHQVRKSRNTAYDLRTLMSVIEMEEGMNLLVKEALIGWLNQLHQTGLFGTEEQPLFKELMQPGKLIIIDFSDMISLRSKQVIVSYVLNKLFELRRANQIPPVVSIVEEAHQFCPEQTGIKSPAKRIIETIAREGRKFMCSLVLVSQRPINLSTTALSQCNSQFILRILNPYDLDYIGKTSEGISRSTLDAITTLGVGECLVTGNAVNYPTFIQVRRRDLKSEKDEVTFESVAREFERK